MIKKNNKILVGALALLLVMTVGYALFSDTLTINGTATAQGNFNLKYECFADGSTMGGTGTCEVNGNTITTTSTLAKPTEGTGYVITITNTGTIPVVLKTVDSPNNYVLDETGKLVTGDEFYIDLETALAAQNYLYSDKCDHVCAGDKIIEDAKITIMPNESQEFMILHMWMDNEELKAIGLNIPSQPVLPEGGATIEYNVTLGFEQITAE